MLSAILLPLLPLAALGAYLAGLGLSDLWRDHTGHAPELPVVLILAVAFPRRPFPGGKRAS